MVKHHLWKLIVAVALAATLTTGRSATSMVFNRRRLCTLNDNFSSATATRVCFSDTV
jgi:hypothetical protein